MTRSCGQLRPPHAGHETGPVDAHAARRSLPRWRRVSRRAAGELPRLHRREGPDALPGAGRGDPRTAGREERHPQHADRFRQVARRLGHAVRVARAGPARGLHLPDQGAGQREVDGALPRVRPRRGGARHRRRHGQPRRADPLLHGRDPRQHGPARGRELVDRPRGDGRVPLVRGPRPRRRLAGAAAHAAAHALPADVGHARRHAVLRGGAHARSTAGRRSASSRPTAPCRSSSRTPRSRWRTRSRSWPTKARRRPTSSTSRRPTRPAARRTSRA